MSNRYRSDDRAFDRRHGSHAAAASAGIRLESAPDFATGDAFRRPGGAPDRLAQRHHHRHAVRTRRQGAAGPPLSGGHRACRRFHARRRVDRPPLGKLPRLSGGHRRSSSSAAGAVRRSALPLACGRSSSLRRVRSGLDGMLRYRCPRRSAAACRLSRPPRLPRSPDLPCRHRRD